MSKPRSTFLLVTLAAVAAVTGVAAVARTAAGGKGIEPAADRMLREMTDYLAGLKSFKVQATSIDQVVLASGQKIQLASESQVSVQRPNRLRSEQLGAGNGLGFFYDGKTMTLACRPQNSYATEPAPPTIDATVDKMRKDFRIDAPGADLLYSKPYDILTEQVKGGRYIGRETLEGVPVNHLAFEGEEVDWQIWIQVGNQPLPMRFVVTTKTMKGQPEFTVQLSHWEPMAKITEATFQFPAVAGAKQVKAFPVGCNPGSAH